MARGTWGGRLPLANLLVSRSFFGFVRLSLAARRFRNSLRRGRRDYILRNDASAAESLRRLLALGYDKLNLGGGPKNLSGFINLDFADYAGVARKVRANLLDLSFVPDGCASHVHTNHVLEHLTGEQRREQLAEYFRILKPRGKLTLRCPNALGAAFGFWFPPVIESGRERFLSAGYPEDDDLGNPADGWMFQDVLGVLHWFHGDPGNLGNQHLSLMTPTLLRSEVEAAGFEVVLASEPEAVNLVLIASKPV